jgi:S1-C subfamily serine protease
VTNGARIAIGLSAVALIAFASACVQAPPSVSRSSTAPTTTRTTAENTSSALLNEARQSVFRVRNTACLAVGTSFETAGVIITNRHVASGASLLELSTWDGSDFNDAITSISSGPDLAVLPGSNHGTPLELAKTDPMAGIPVWVTGYPEGNQLSALSGQITDYISGAPYGEPGQIIEMSNAIEPGNSGSPLLNASGQVVGVAFAISKLDGAGLAIPVSTLRSFLSAPGTNTTGECDDSGSTGNTGNSGNTGSGNTGNS